MKDGRDKKDLLDVLSKYVPLIIRSKSKMDEISSHLYNKHNINLGRIMAFFRDINKLNDAELVEIALISEQVGIKLQVDELDLTHWFNPIEIKRFRQYRFVSIDDVDKIELPLTFENVEYLGRGAYQVAIELKTIARMYKWKLLNYNPKFQRELRVTNQNGKIKKEIKVYTKNVKEIKEEVLKDELDKTALAYNCAVDSSEDESEQEILFDKDTNTLVITKGTVIDILDGTHRTMGIYEAYKENPDLVVGKITVLISNYTDEQAMKYQVSLAKATPFNKARAKELAKERLSDELVDRLKSAGELKGKISSINSDAERRLGFLTSSEILSDSFDRNWEPEKRGEIKNIMMNFNKYLEFLFEYYEDLIEDNNNLLFNKLFFAGHIVLAKRMFDNNIPYEDLNLILDNIDFDKNNNIWKELNIINKEDRLLQNPTIIKRIENYFKNIEMKVNVS